MKDDDLARWATKFAKKGVRGAVNHNVAASPPPPAQRQWGQPMREGVPWGEPTRGSTWGGRPPELETLVKPGPSGYAELLARVPELAPDVAKNNAMEGPLDAEQEAAQREALMGLDRVSGVRPDDGRDAVPRAYRGPTTSAPIEPLVKLQRPN